MAKKKVKPTIIDEIKSQCDISRKTWLDKLTPVELTELKEVKSAWLSGEISALRISSVEIYRFVRQRYPHIKVGKSTFKEWLNKK